MADARSLHAVKPGESRRPRVRPKSVTQAAARGSERELLAATRAVVAKAVEAPNTSTRDLAALTRRLLEIDRDIRAIDARAGGEGDGVGRAAATPDESWSESAI